MKKLILLFIILFEISCFNRNTDKVYFSNQDKGNTTVSTTVADTIPVSKKKLELYLGGDYKIVQYQIINLDTDIEDELIIATEEKDKNVKINIFDILKNSDIKLKYEYKTDIFYNDDFNLQVHNLFEADDIGILLEGKSGDNKNWLYIFSFVNDNYDLLGEFTGDFSILTDYAEIDPGINKQKYIALDQVVTINNIFSSTNTSLHEKSVYKWDIADKQFKLIEKSKVCASSLSSIDNSITSTKENFFHYISGFWYPVEYLKEIKNNFKALKKNNSKSVNFILFNKKDISIKMDDYVTKYKITKMIKLWGNKPKLRLKISNFSSLTANSYKKIDITLLSPSKIQTSGPGKYDSWTFVRLQKPLIEYLNDKIDKRVRKRIKEIKNKIIGDFIYDKNFHINFDINSNFTIVKNNVTEFGIYQILHNETKYIINFIFESKKSLLKDELFIIDINTDNSLVLIPIKFGINTIIIKNLKSLILYKSN